MRDAGGFSPILKSFSVLALTIFIPVHKTSFGALDHESAGPWITAPEAISQSAGIRFTEETPFYQSLIKLVKQASNSEENSPGTREEALQALKIKLRELDRLAPQISQQDRARFNDLAGSIRNILSPKDSVPVTLQSGSLETAINELFPREKSIIFGRPQKNFTEPLSATDEAKHFLLRMKAFQEKLNRETDPLKQTVLKYTLMGELTSLAELRPKVIIEQNGTRKNHLQEQAWQALKQELDQKFEEFKIRQENQKKEPSFKITNKEDFDFLLRYEAALKNIIDGNSSNTDQRDEALALRRGLLVSFSRQYRTLEKMGALDNKPFSDYRYKMEALATELDSINNNIIRTNNTIDIAENAKKVFLNNQKGISDLQRSRSQASLPRSNQETASSRDLRQAIEMLRNQASTVSKSIGSSSNLGPNLLQSYKNSLKQLKSQEASLTALLDKTSTSDEKLTKSSTEPAKSQISQGATKRDSFQTGTQSDSRNIKDRVSEFSGSRSQKVVNNSHQEEETGTLKSTAISSSKPGNPGRNTPETFANSVKPTSSTLPVSVLKNAPRVANDTGRIETSTNTGTNANKLAESNGIATPRFPASFSAGNFTEKNDAKSNFMEKPKTNPEPLQAEETGAPAFQDGEGLSLRKKEAAIKNGKARRNDFSNIGNSNAANYYYAGDSKTTSANSTAPSNDLGQKENGYILNSDGTFSPASFKARGMGQKEFANEEKFQGQLIENAAAKSLTNQTNLIDIEGLDLGNAGAPQKQELSLLAKLGLQPKIDSIEQYLANLLPSESGKPSDIRDLIDNFQRKRFKKPFNRELSTVDPKKPEQVKRLILSTYSSGTQAQISLWDKLIAWLGIKR